MKIRHERPMSDLSFKVRAPLELLLATGDRVTIEQWSLAGLAFPGDSDVLPTQAVLSIPFQGVDIQFPVSFHPATDDRFLRFDGLSGRQRETLAIFFRSLLSGRMASTQDVITSLDTPVDLVPIEETEEERTIATARTSPRAFRAAWNVMVSALIAFVVAWTLGQGVWSGLSSIKVQSARIEAAIATRLAPEGAFVAEILVAEGETVSAGQILVRLTTPESETAMANVRGRIALIEDRLEQALLRAAALEQRIASARAVIDPSDRAAIAEFDTGLSIPHLSLFETHASVLREVEMIEDELRRLRRERGRIGDARDAMHVIASQDGHVREIAVLEGQFVPRGDPVALTEAADARLARGWVDPDLARAVFAGMEVTVSANMAGEHRQLSGRVVHVEAGIDPELSPEFGMLVSVEFSDLSPEEVRETLPHTLPVDIRILRPWAARLEAWEWAWWSEDM